MLSDDEIVLRHIPATTTFLAPGPRVTSKNFELRTLDRGLSVSLKSLTSPDQLIDRIGNRAAGSRVAELTIGEIRGLGLDVIPDAIDPDDLGHCLIVAATHELSSQKLRRDLARLCRLIPA